MGGNPGASEAHSLRGPVDRAVLTAIRDVIIDSEPLASAALDDFFNPRVLEVRFDVGLCDAESARIDVQWTTRGDYKFHYTDSADVNVRWGMHPHDGTYVNATGFEHYHPPPDASTDPAVVEESCISQSHPKLVTRAVLTLWRVAFHSGSYAPLNAGSNPP